LVYRSTASWYLPVLKATFPSSLVFSAIVKVLSCGSDAGLGVGGGEAVGNRGVSGSMFEEPDPDAWLAQKSVIGSFFASSVYSTYRWCRLCLGQTWLWQ
jgi:hypothetical protein